MSLLRILTTPSAFPLPPVERNPGCTYSHTPTYPRCCPSPASSLRHHQLSTLLPSSSILRCCCLHWLKRTNRAPSLTSSASCLALLISHSSPHPTISLKPIPNRLLFAWFCMWLWELLSSRSQVVSACSSSVSSLSLFPLLCVWGRADPGSQQPAQHRLASMSQCSSLSLLSPGIAAGFLPTLVTPSLGSVISSGPPPFHPSLNMPLFPYPLFKLYFSMASFPSLSTYFLLFSWLIWTSSPTLPVSRKASATSPGPGAVNRRGRSFPGTAWHTTLSPAAFSLATAI